MTQLTIFLNELSFAFEEIPRKDWATHVLNTIQSIAEVRKLRKDMCLVLNRHPSLIMLGAQNDSSLLGAVIGGGLYEDEWTLLRQIAEVSPHDACDESLNPEAIEDVRFRNVSTTAMVWAWKAKSFVASFGHAAHWLADIVTAELCTVDDKANLHSENVKIKNIATKNNVAKWRIDVLEYGMDFSTSSLIFHNPSFAVRMYLRDHDPPHIHVFPTSHSQVLLARLNIRRLEYMEGTRDVLPIRAELLDWAKTNQVALMNNWTRCRHGQLPISM
jgi:Domain of unknown function (DUF4160)